MNSDLKKEIARHKQAEELLRDERDKVQKYLNVAGVIMLAINADETVKLINKKGCEILVTKESKASQNG